MGRDVLTESQHNSMIRKQIQAYKRAGYINIKASHINYHNGSPVKVNGHIPDISAEKNNEIVICEVETIDSFSDLHAEAQWKAFANCGLKFDICVPHQVLDKAKEEAEKLGIKVNRFWWKK